MRTTHSETAAILAGIRLVQQQMAPVPGGDDVSDILTDCGAVHPLSVRQLTALAERIGKGR